MNTVRTRILQAVLFAAALGMVPAGMGTLLLAAPQKPDAKTGKIEQGKEYTSRSRLFTVKVPPAQNPFVRTYFFQESDLKHENYDYEEVVFHIPDFGQAFGAGVRKIPQAVLSQMAKEEMKQTLSNLAWKALGQWRDLAEEPKTVEDSDVETQFGPGLLRVFLAPKGSLMTRLVVSGPSADPKPQKFDTHIAVLVVKQGDRFIYASAQDDYLQTNASAPPAGPFNPVPMLKEELQAFFSTITVKK